MSVDEATFYRNVDYVGEPYAYKLGTQESLPGDLNDRFRSVRVGELVKVLAWQHYGQSGRYREWEVDTPDITDVGGLSTFRVVEKTTLAIAVRLQDDTGAAPGRYSLKVVSYEVGEITTPSGDPEYALVGFMPAGGPPVTTAIYVRNEQTGEFVAIGSVYFVWNPQTSAVDVADETNFPENMTYERAGSNRFTFHLTATR
ncbi:beta/gamma crystallin domain-containing protein [Nocardia tengchongensis]|uniref:beta/gamma crystallin domain-containing protein n=1 Tax=Nocardia tengchongensis TaxID=2055889 RepID=UPI0036BB8019